MLIEEIKFFGVPGMQKCKWVPKIKNDVKNNVKTSDALNMSYFFEMHQKSIFQFFYKTLNCLPLLIIASKT